MTAKQMTGVVFSQKELSNILAESRNLNGNLDTARIQITLEDGTIRVSHPDNGGIEHDIEPVNDKNGH